MSVQAQTLTQAGIVEGANVRAAFVNGGSVAGTVEPIYGVLPGATVEGITLTRHDGTRTVVVLANCTFLECTGSER